MLKMPLSDLAKFFKEIGLPVYVPAEKDGCISFTRWSDEVTPCLERVSTDKSPKDVFFPQWEDLMQLRLSGKTIQIAEQERSSEKFVVFGARACDIRALEVLDRVFLADPVDSFYAARRANGILIGLACGEPEDSCFCSVFGIDPAEPRGDISAWIDGDFLYLRAENEKGNALLAGKNLPEVSDGEVLALQNQIREAISEKPFANLSLKSFEEGTLKDLFNSPKWKKLSLACLGCGSCTFSCPTCQCYDIRDYNTGDGVERYRCWDSCMYSDFTLMAAGTPRPTQTERFRQRFMHKLVYFPENNDGMYSCVGCGRCVRKCPMNLNIVKVIRAFGEEKDE